MSGVAAFPRPARLLAAAFVGLVAIGVTGIRMDTDRNFVVIPAPRIKSKGGPG